MKSSPHKLILFDESGLIVAEVGVSPCPVCGALIAENESNQHGNWHKSLDRTITDAKYSQF